MRVCPLFSAPGSICCMCFQESVGRLTLQATCTPWPRSTAIPMSLSRKDPIKHDMLVKVNKTNLMTRIYAGEFHAAFLTPACSSWSRVRFAPHGPKPVRNLSNPRGFPWLLGAQLKGCTDANELVDLVIELVYAMHSVKGQYLIEHPEDLGCTKEGHMPASIWQLTAVRDLATETQAHTAAIFQCSPPGSVDAPGDSGR